MTVKENNHDDGDLRSPVEPLMPIPEPILRPDILPDPHTSPSPSCLRHTTLSLHANDVVLQTRPLHSNDLVLPTRQTHANDLVLYTRPTQGNDLVLHTEDLQTTMP
jgi:hypothetical protein